MGNSWYSGRTFNCEGSEGSWTLFAYAVVIQIPIRNSNLGPPEGIVEVHMGAKLACEGVV